MQHQAQGNGCPQLQNFDVLGVYIGGTGAPVGDETYTGAIKTNVEFASVANDMSGGPDYKSVVDGQSIHYRRDPADCQFWTANTQNETPEPAVLERLTEVLTWFGYTGSVAPCEDPTAGTGLRDIGRTPTFKTALANFAPNPLQGGAKGNIQFSMAREGKASVEIFDVSGRLVRTVFDGIAPEGVNVVHWSGRDAHDRPVASGVYFYRLKTHGEEFAHKLVVVQN